MHNRLQATKMVAQLAAGPSLNAAPDKGAIMPCPQTIQHAPIRYPLGEQSLAYLLQTKQPWHHSPGETLTSYPIRSKRII